VKLIMSWFGRRDCGRAMGLFMTATSLGVVITNAAVPHLLQEHLQRKSACWFKAPLKSA
jgi:MFS transporter, ACS family, glucarate transporter